MSNPEPPNPWAALILELIARPGWSQQRLADAAEVDRATIRRWKIGESVNVSSQSIKLLAQAAGIPVDVAARAAAGGAEAVRDDWAIREVEASHATDDEKDRIVAEIRHKRAAFDASLRRDLDFWLRKSQGDEERAS